MFGQVLLSFPSSRALTLKSKWFDNYLVRPYLGLTFLFPWLLSDCSAQFIRVGLDPLRIAVVPGSILDVVVRGQSASQDNSHIVATSNTTPRRNPVYGLENTAMDNYTHIDRPSNIIALTQSMTRRRSREIFGANSSRDNTTVTPAATHSAARNQMYGDESKAMDIYTYISNSTATSLRRAPHTILDDQPTFSINNKTPVFQLPIDQGQPSALQEQTSIVNSYFTNAMAKANTGDKGAQIALGRWYRSERGAEQDYQSAAEWFLKAANQGSPDAQVELGQLYRDGKGVEKNHTTAVEWFRKASEQGDA